MRRFLAFILALAVSTPAFADSLGSATGGTRGTQSSLAGGTYNSAPPSLSSGQQAALQMDSSGNLKVSGASTVSGNVGLTSLFPAGAAPITASATGTTAATTATLAGTSGKTTYICGFAIRANATAAATGNATVTGTVTGTMNFTQWTAPLATGIGIVAEVFTPCIPASAANTGIAVVSAAPGTGGTVSVSAWGYQL